MCLSRLHDTDVFWFLSEFTHKVLPMPETFMEASTTYLISFAYPRYLSVQCVLYQIFNDYTTNYLLILYKQYHRHFLTLVFKYFVSFDVLSFNNSSFGDLIHCIYLKQLEKKNTTDIVQYVFFSCDHQHIKSLR